MVKSTLRGTAVALAVPMVLRSVAGAECSRQIGTRFQALWTRGVEAYLSRSLLCCLTVQSSVRVFRSLQHHCSGDKYNRYSAPESIVGCCLEIKSSCVCERERERAHATGKNPRVPKRGTEGDIRSALGLVRTPLYESTSRCINTRFTTIIVRLQFNASDSNAVFSLTKQLIMLG
jgi:hypothetical protein